MFDNRSPIYQQIADQIKHDILHGTLSAEAQVMSTNQYAVFYRINPATAAKAFQLLVEEGFLYKRRGIGMFVSPDARERLRTQHREIFFAQVEAMLVEARAVGVSRSEIVDYIENEGGESR